MHAPIPSRAGDFFRPLAPGAYAVTATAVGYEPMTLSASAFFCTPGNTTTLSFVLAPSPFPAFAIALFVVGGVAAAVIVALALWFGLRRQKQSAERAKVRQTESETLNEDLTVCCGGRFSRPWRTARPTGTSPRPTCGFLLSYCCGRHLTASPHQLSERVTVTPRAISRVASPISSGRATPSRQTGLPLPAALTAPAAVHHTGRESVP
jgi:hypothetical protein